MGIFKWNHRSFLNFDNFQNQTEHLPNKNERLPNKIVTLLGIIFNSLSYALEKFPALALYNSMRMSQRLLKQFFII